MRVALALVAIATFALTAFVVEAAIDTGTAVAAPVRVDLAADGSRVVTLVDPRQSPDAVSRALGAAGIRSEIVEVTSGPSRVNTIVSIAIDRELQLRQPSRPSTISLPAGYDGTVVLTVGAATPAGQQYDTPSDPFAAGEPLAHFDGVRTAAAVARAATEQGITVAVVGIDGQPVPDAAVGDDAVLVAFMVAADSLVLRLG